MAQNKSMMNALHVIAVWQKAPSQAEATPSSNKKTRSPSHC